MSWPSGYAWPSVVRITTICRLPNRLPDCALARSCASAEGLFTEVPGETVRKGYEQHSDRGFWAVYGGQNGPKSTVSASRRATPQTPPRLFGRVQKWCSRRLAYKPPS